MTHTRHTEGGGGANHEDGVHLPVGASIGMQLCFVEVCAGPVCGFGECACREGVLLFVSVEGLSHGSQLLGGGLPC